MRIIVRYVGNLSGNARKYGEGSLSGAAARTGNFRIRKEIEILKKGIGALYKKQQRRTGGEKRKLGILYEYR